MAIYCKNSKLKICKGEGTPVSFYRGSQKIAGYGVTQIDNTQNIINDGYDDFLHNLVIKGDGWQETGASFDTPKGIGWVSSPSFTSVSGEKTTVTQFDDLFLRAIKDENGDFVARDYIDFENNRIVRQVGYHQFNGRESLIQSSYTDADFLVALYKIDDCMLLGSNGYFSHGTVLASNAGKFSDTDCFAYNSNSYHYIVVPVSKAGSVSALKSYFESQLSSGTPVTICYILKDEAYEGIPETLSSIKVKTYYGSTQINSQCDFTALAKVSEV